MTSAAEAHAEGAAKAPAEPITVRVIHDLLRNGVQREGKTPEPAALVELAYEADDLRQVFRQQTLIDWKAQADVESLVEQLVKALPGVISTNEKMREHINSRQDGSSIGPDRMGEALRDLESAARRMLEPGVGIGWGIFPDIRTWRHFAVPLARTFKKTIEKANPGLRLGLANHGPIARFLSAIIPLITGETATEDNVMRHLQEEAKKGNTDSKPLVKAKAGQLPG